MLNLPTNTTLGEIGEILASRFNKLAVGGVEKHHHGLYYKSVALAEDMRSHIDLEYKPEPPKDNYGRSLDTSVYDGVKDREKYDLFARSWLYRYRPNESPQVRSYRLTIWENVTASLMSKPLIFLSRLFNKKLTQIIYPPVLPARTSGRDIKQYVSNIGFMGWLKNTFLKTDIIDPNGFVVVRTDVSDAQLESSELPSPKPMCVPSSHVVDYGHNFLVTLSTDKSEVVVGSDGQGNSKTEFSGWVFFVYLPDVTFRVFQIGEKHKYQFFAEPWNVHLSGIPAFIQNGGDLAAHKDKVESSRAKEYFQSFLQPALPHLNELASLHSNQQAAFIMRIFLERYQKARTCKTCEGTGKVKIEGPTHKDHTHKTCPSCNGEKVDIPNSPFKTFNIHGTKPTDELQAPAAYVEIPMDIVDATEAKLKTLRFQAFSSIHMESLEQENKVTSAVGIEKEREGLYTLLENISFNSFERVGQFCLDMINIIRYGALLGTENLGSNRPILVAPTNFDIRTLGDSIAEHKEMSDTDQPQGMKIASLLRIAAQSYGETSATYKQIRTEILVDPLAAMSDDQIIVGSQTTNSLTDYQVFIHYNASAIVSDLMLLDSEYLDRSDEDKIQIFNTEAEKRFAENAESDPIQTAPPAIEGTLT